MNGFLDSNQELFGARRVATLRRSLTMLTP